MSPLFESYEFTTLKFEASFGDGFAVSLFGLFFELHD